MSARGAPWLRTRRSWPRRRSHVLLHPRPAPDDAPAVRRLRTGLGADLRRREGRRSCSDRTPAEPACATRTRRSSNGPGWGELVGPFFDRGLMLLDFEEHHRHRRLMQDAFTRPRLAGYTAALGPAVAAGLDAWQPGPDFRVYPALKSLTLDLATQVFMGGADLASPGELDRVNDAFVACVQAAAGIIRKPLPGTRWGRAMKGRLLLEEFFGRHLASKRASRGEDLFSVLCALRDEDGLGLSVTATWSTT